MQLGVEGVTLELIEKYLHLSTTTPRPQTIAGIYERILESAQNAGMKPAVIGGAIGGVDKLGKVLCDFDPKQILEEYPSEWESVLEEIVAQLLPPGVRINRTPKGLWPKYCRTILSSAKFLSQFSAADDFYSWADFFDKDERARPALPMLLAQEVDGLGFALACDFLKELGYENFAKPDVHIKDIFQAIGLCASRASDYEVFKAVVRVAGNVGVTPYNVDKLFWLIGSGYFYDDELIGNKGRVGGRKKEFVEVARREMSDGRMKEIESHFNQTFSNWNITLPPDDIANRGRGKITKAGWTIWYQFGSDEKGEYLDYYSSHRMTYDDHARIYADGEIESLPAIESARLISQDPEEDARREAEHFARNQRTAKMLEEKGFGIEGDEPGGVQINRFLSLGGMEE